MSGSTTSSENNIRPIDMAKAVSQRQFERVMSEFNKISEWVSKNFSEVTFRVEFNDDSQNPVDPAFRIKTRLMTTKMMDLNDQLLRKHEFVIRSVIWEDAILMEKWINNLYPSITSSISDLINNWYARKKVEGTAL